jgi:RimJ/RimL family protein N-acetyltransferase
VNHLELAPWGTGDRWLIDATMGDPAMTEYLGGPEPDQKLAERHERYLDLSRKGTARMMKILRPDDGRVVGTIGYWMTTWDGEDIFEMGWSVLPEFQGQGIATDATLLTADLARADGRRRYLHAFPSVDNAASNAVCRKAGFTNVGEVRAEFPPGHPITCHNWRLDLQAEEASGGG